MAAKKPRKAAAQRKPKKPAGRPVKKKKARTKPKVRPAADIASDALPSTGNASISLAAGGEIDRSDTPLPARAEADAAILSNWVPPPPDPLPPRRMPIADMGGPASPPYPPVEPPPQQLSTHTVSGVGSAAGVGDAKGVGTFILDAKQSSFDTLMARVALLEATVAARPAGVGHNHGPDLDDNLSVDEAGIQNLIALLKEQHATAPVDLPRLADAARIADPAINKWRARIDWIATAVITGALGQIGKDVVKQLEHTAWVQSVYSALQNVFEALMSWMNLF